VSRAGLIAFCGLLLSVSAFSCDITLPAFWSMQSDLGAPIEWVQAVVPVFLIFQSVGQLAFGPVSDRYGRRPVILAGLVLYLIGAAIASLAQGIGVVHVGRAAQGFGSACGIAVGRAVLRDISHGPALAQAMAMAMAIFALGPISAPLVGYGLVALGGWRAIFLGMAIFATLLLVLAAVWFQETNAAPDPCALQPKRLMQSLGRIVSNRQSRYFLIVATVAQFGIISFVANAPRFFKSAFGIEGLQFALLTGTAHQQSPDRAPRRAGDHARRRLCASGGDGPHRVAFAGWLPAWTALHRPDVRFQHELHGGHGQQRQPGHRSAPGDRGLRLVGVWLLHADDGIDRGHADGSAVQRRAAAVDPQHARGDGCRVRSACGIQP
jgi:multidrug resistance protein